jgi:hypothetical protein
MGPASAARSALAAIEPSDAPGRLDEAVATALALSGTGGDVRVFTDQARAASLPGSVLWRSFGESSRNVAIVAMDSQTVAPAAEAGGGAAARLFLAVRNYSGESLRVALVAAAIPGKEALARGELELPPLGRGACIMELPLTAGLRAVEVSLDAEDDLAPDNFARALVSSRRPFRVALVGRSSPAVARAVRAVEDLSELVELAPGGGEAALDADMTVYSGALPRAEIGGGDRPAMFVFPGASVGPLVVDPQALGNAAPIEPAADAGLLAGLDLSAVRAPRIRRVSVTGAFRALATAGGVPVLGEWEDGRARRYYLGLAPDESTWPDDPSWPILWARLAERHAPPAAGGLCWREVSDDSPLRGAPELAVLSGPRGERAAGTGALAAAGFYSAGGRLVAAVNVLDELASDNRPAGGPSADLRGASGPRSAGRPVERAARPWLLAAALALMIAEALLASRR